MTFRLINHQRRNAEHATVKRCAFKPNGFTHVGIDLIYRHPWQLPCSINDHIAAFQHVSPRRMIVERQ